MIEWMDAKEEKKKKRMNLNICCLPRTVSRRGKLNKQHTGLLPFLSRLPEEAGSWTQDGIPMMQGYATGVKEAQTEMLTLHLRLPQLRHRTLETCPFLSEDTQQPRAD